MPSQIVTPKLLSEHTNVAKNFSLESPGISSADNLVFLLYPVARSVELLLTNWLEKLPDEVGNSPITDSNKIFRYFFRAMDQITFSSSPRKHMCSEKGSRKIPVFGVVSAQLGVFLFTGFPANSPGW
jgi:hypothetical protein